MCSSTRPDCRSVTAVWALSSWSVPRAPRPLLSVTHLVHYNARTTASTSGGLGAAIFSAPRRTLSPRHEHVHFSKCRLWDAEFGERHILQHACLLALSSRRQPEAPGR